jgi:hypothetical protein
MREQAALEPQNPTTANLQIHGAASFRPNAGGANRLGLCASTSLIRRILCSLKKSVVTSPPLARRRASEVDDAKEIFVMSKPIEPLFVVDKIGSPWAFSPSSDWSERQLHPFEGDFFGWSDPRAPHEGGEDGDRSIHGGTEPKLTAPTVQVTVGHSQSDVNLTKSILAALSALAPNGGDKVIGFEKLFDTKGSLSLNSDGVLLYTPSPSGPLGGVDTFLYEIQGVLNANLSAVNWGAVKLFIDPGPTTRNASVTYEPFTTQPVDDLTSAILQAVKPGLPGDTITITSATGEIGTATLNGGDVTYAAQWASPLLESIALTEVYDFGTITDGVNYTVTDQYGDSANGFLAMNVLPYVYSTAIGAVSKTTQPLNVINAAESNILWINNDSVVFASAGELISVNASASAIIDLQKTNNSQIYQQGDGFVQIDYAGAYNQINLGNGNDIINMAGSHNSVTLGSGNDTVNLDPGGYDTVSLGAGQSDYVAAPWNAAGYDDITLSGSAAQVVLSGNHNTVVVDGGVDTVNNVGGGSFVLDMSQGPGGSATVDGKGVANGTFALAASFLDPSVFGPNPTAASIATYMNAHNGVLTFAGGAGQLDLVGAAGQLTAASFQIH